jgi:hypothetical protein
MSTGTYPEDQMTSGQAYTKDIKNGYLSPCFHYFIEPDGNVECGRELEVFAGGLKKHNKHSVIVKWSGGKDKRLKRLADNMTAEQVAVIPDIIDELRELFPEAEVISYDRLIKLNKACNS